MLIHTIFLFSIFSWAQELKEMKPIQSIIAVKAIDTYLSKRTKEGLSGEFILSLLPTQSPASEKCEKV